MASAPVDHGVDLRARRAALPSSRRCGDLRRGGALAGSGRDGGGGGDGQLRADGGASPLDMGGSVRARMGRHRRTRRLDDLQLQWPGRIRRISVPCRGVRGAAGLPAVPDGARRRRLAADVGAGAQPRLDRRGDRRGQHRLRRRRLPARLADSQPVQPDRHRLRRGFAGGRLVRLEPGGFRVRRRVRVAARARCAGGDDAAAGDDHPRGAGTGAGGRARSVPPLSAADRHRRVVGQLGVGRGADAGGRCRRLSAAQCRDRPGGRGSADEQGAALVGDAARAGGVASSGPGAGRPVDAHRAIWLDAGTHLGGDLLPRRADLWRRGLVGGVARTRRVRTAYPLGADAVGGGRVRARPAAGAADPRFRRDLDPRPVGPAARRRDSVGSVRLAGDGVRFRAGGACRVDAAIAQRPAAAARRGR